MSVANEFEMLQKILLEMKQIRGAIDCLNINAINLIALFRKGIEDTEKSLEGRTL